MVRLKSLEGFSDDIDNMGFNSNMVRLKWSNNCRISCTKSVSIPIWYGLNHARAVRAAKGSKFQFQYGTA